MLKHQDVDLDAILAAVAHPIRRAIVERLAQGECTVKELAEPHHVSAPAISQHLRVLEEAGLLEQVPDGRVRRCSLRAGPLSEAFSWFLQYRVFWENELDNIQKEVEGESTMTQTRTETKSNNKASGQTLRLSRVMKAPRERVFRAFVNADAYAKWLPPHGYVGKVHHMDARPGGSLRMTFAALDGSDVHSFQSRFVEVVPNERIVHIDRFETDAPDMQNEMRVTITFEEVEGGTEVHIIQENIPTVIPVSNARTGWGQSLDNLARLVEI